MRSSSTSTMESKTIWEIACLMQKQTTKSSDISSTPSKKKTGGASAASGETEKTKWKDLPWKDERLSAMESSENT